MEETPSSTPRRPRRDRRRERNRRRLIDATLALVAKHGTAGLSVSRISRDAGIEPPNFYAHFKNVEECEKAAADELDSYLLAKIAPYQQAAQGSFDEEGLSKAYTVMLESWLEEPLWCRLMLQARHESSFIGERMQRILDAVRQDFRQVIVGSADLHRVPRPAPAELDALVEACLGLFMGLFEAVTDGRIQDVELAARQLARGNRAVVKAELKRLAAERKQTSS